MKLPSPRPPAEIPHHPRRAGRIEDHGLVGNGRTSALVDRDGNIDWMCLPRFDSAAAFTALLGSENHGMWLIGPAGPHGTAPAADGQRYLDGTLILESTWITPSGTIQLLDFMPFAEEDDVTQLVRIVKGVSGRVPMRSILRARPGYGRAVPRLDIAGRRANVGLGEGRLWLDTDARTRASGGDLISEFSVAKDEQLAFTLAWQPGGHEPPPLPAPGGLLKQSEDFWAGWTAKSTYSGPHWEAAERSLITLKALQYRPTGGFVAAPTTSLPEEIGGERNWDYRYCWPRDSAMTVEALLSCGYSEEARAWIGWLRTAIGGRPENLQAIYRVDGSRELTEAELSWLPGFENSAPVRIGNGAAKQLQLDVYGEIVGALYAAQEHDPELAPVVAPIITDLVACLEILWEQPDEGIWEVRGPRRHFVHSKVMAWCAVDRAVRLIEGGRADGPLPRWRELRDAIHQQVCERGYEEERNTFTQSYGSTELDVSLLQIVTTGFLPPDDKRVIGTVEAIQQELSTTGGFLLRYRTGGEVPGVDGLAGNEGTFLIGSGWLIVALCAIGRVDEAEIHLESLLRVRSDLGLLAEEWDVQHQRQLGNFPQGFSHIAVIQAIRAVATARAAQGRRIAAGVIGR
ncbi:glycoside hydrolase family 15 protein [Streptomyces sp. NPDC058052]|uniref:glycoside hydrolase family 15 protein n=1 Tax=Streptomyces sp. NPDC058052 TaxID=3346316 RepID=UPI0036F0EAF2